MEEKDTANGEGRLIQLLEKYQNEEISTKTLDAWESEAIIPHAKEAQAQE